MLAVVSHDAGGAEVVSSYVRRQSGSDVLFVLDGPARKVFQRKLGAIDVISLDKALEQCDSVLTGTSWQSDLEFDTIRLAKQAGKPSVAFIDHWINYAERFTRMGTTHLPDEIWVGDSIAQSIAKREFSVTPVRVVDNPYFADIRDELLKVPAKTPRPIPGVSVLYVCEPVREHALRHYGDERHFGYMEEEALRFFLDNAGALGTVIGRMTIRPHPSEARDKYDWARTGRVAMVEIGGQRSLVEEVADTDIVVGCESMAMVVGLLAMKRVVSCVPPGGKPCGLPQGEIEHLQSLIASRDQRSRGSAHTAG